VREYAQQHQTKLRLQKPYPQHWTNISIGSSQATISLTIQSQKGEFGAEIYIPDSKDLYERLFTRKSDIEQDLGETLLWMELPEKKASRIKATTTGDLENKSGWNTYFDWLLRQAEKFQSVFPKYLKQPEG